MAFYRNRGTGKVSEHPKSGLGDLFNSDEIEDDGKPIKPKSKLGTTRKQNRARGARPARPRAPRAPKTPEATSGTGSTNQKGAD